MKKTWKLTAVMTGLGMLLAVGMALAAANFSDVIRMENKDAYEEHTQAIVDFTHLKHYEDYEIGCGECHHDDTGTPLDLQMGDDVESCLDCHQPGRADRADLRGLSREERQVKELQYHYGAIHQNCQGCHEDYNKEKVGDARKGPAPVSCTDCHPREDD